MYVCYNTVSKKRRESADMDKEQQRKRIEFLLQYADDWVLDKTYQIVIKLINLRNKNKK